MDYALRDALRQLTRFESGTRTLLREVDDDDSTFNSSLTELMGAQAQGPDLHFIIGSESHGTVSDSAAWACLG